ncbi:MAG: histidine kinase [Allosphingosinicella sp.]|uniref:histidine kinase n=1 Tax=Allosphingosinicella sp. TaxID=2823234 RepID=UPI00394BA999
MVSGRGLWQHARVISLSRDRHHWIFGIAALAVWVAIGWPVVYAIMTGAEVRGSPVPLVWLACFFLFGASAFAASVLRLGTRAMWTLLGLQVAATVAMAYLGQWAMMAVFLIIPAWQAATTTSLARALGWTTFQSLAVIGALAIAPNPDLCWVVAKALGLQLLLVFGAQALRREAEAARVLADTNRELRAAQALIVSTVRQAERLRISRELHDAWGNELTALGLQLEIASHVQEPDGARGHVAQAKGLAGALLAKVREVVATLREDERGNMSGGLTGGDPSPST